MRAFAVDRYDALVLAERPTAVDPEIAATLLAGRVDRSRARATRTPACCGGCGSRARTPISTRSFARPPTASARSTMCNSRRALPPDVLRALDRDAPESLLVPSGRHLRLEYNDDGTVSAAVKLQEVFGLAETPRIGPRREPVLLALTAPNGRPVQLTRDLRSFWDRTYPEVRKELRGRYPKHPWPEDPWTAPPTARAKRKV